MLNLDKAKYILFPFYNKTYYLYQIKSKIYKLPIIFENDNVMYSSWPGNEHHYTTSYSIKYVLPLLNRILNFNYNRNDFLLKNFKYCNNDLSYLIPHKEYMYKIYSYSYNKLATGTYSHLVLNFIYKTLPSTTAYHLLYIFPHQCSKIINTHAKTNKKLFISGDSLIIPCIMPLSYYYQELFYFDNRLNGGNVPYDDAPYMLKNIENIEFDDILISLYANPIEKYTKINLK